MYSLIVQDLLMEHVKGRSQAQELLLSSHVSMFTATLPCSKTTCQATTMNDISLVILRNNNKLGYLAFEKNALS